MADDQENIRIQIDTNASEAATDMNRLGASLDATEERSENLTQANRDLQRSQRDVSKATDDQKAGFEDLGGGIGEAASSVKSLGKQFLLLLANPIILFLAAIVGALTLLYKAFASTNDGADKMEQIWAGLGAVIDVIRDRILKAADAIGKFLTGDFKGAMVSAHGAVSGFGDEVAAEFKKAADATAQLQEVEDAMRGLGEARAKLNRDLSETKEIITDETATYAQKKAAIDAVRKAEGEQTEKELENARKKLKAIQDLNALSDTSDEDLDKESQAKIALYNLEQESANNRRAINKADARADNEEKARLKALSDARAAATKERLAQIEALRKARKALLDEELTAEQATLRKIQDLNDKSDEEKLARQKERDLAEIERMREKGVEVRDILTLNNELYITLEKELADRRAEEAAAKQKEIDDKKAEEDKKKIAEDLEYQKTVDAAILEQEKSLQESRKTLADKFVGFLSAIAGKNKALQKAAIIAESALGIGRSIIATNASNVAATAEGAALAIPTGGASVATAASLVATNYVALGLGVGSNIAATAKALQALGGGSAPSASGGGSGGGTPAPPAVSFNNTAENQIGQSVARTQGEQPPAQVVVLESDITNAQRNVSVLENNNVF